MRSAVSGPSWAAASREITSAPKAVCWLSAAAPAQTLPSSSVVTNAATVVLPRSMASPSGTPARRWSLPGSEDLIGVDHDGRQRDGDVAQDTRPARQPVVGGPLGRGEAGQLVVVDWAERALGHDLALEAGAAAGAGLLDAAGRLPVTAFPSRLSGIDL